MQGPRKRHILRDVSGVSGPVPSPGLDSQSHASMLAILGPSGAGKTTLLDVLAGRRMGVGVSGEVYLNGNAVTSADLRRLAG